MTDKAKTETLTLILRQSTRDVDGATHVIRDGKGHMLVAWPEGGIARYNNGTIAPCNINADKFDALLREFNSGAPLNWKKVGDHSEATVQTATGKIEVTCKAR